MNDNVPHRFATARRERFIGNGLQRQGLAASHLLVGGDHGHRAGIDDPLAQRLRGESGEDDGMHRSDARARLHRGNALDGHWHVNDDPVAFGDPHGTQAVGQLADLRMQLRIRDPRDQSVVGLKHDRRLVRVAQLQVAVQAVVRNVELPVLEPAVERRMILVQRPGERLVPADAIACVPSPEAFIVCLCGRAEGLIGRHARNVRLIHELGRRIDELELLLQGCNIRHWQFLWTMRAWVLRVRPESTVNSQRSAHERGPDSLPIRAPRRV